MRKTILKLPSPPTVDKLRDSLFVGATLQSPETPTFLVYTY